MNDRDIILIIENWINEQKKEHFIVNFKELDSILSLSEGSTERNIKVAADKAGFDIYFARSKYRFPIAQKYCKNTLHSLSPTLNND